ncbi:hypothetical protein ACFOWE_31370 [Planomonospora corallina]|uniref:Uncharacterized protein n=1 Tax=Planomonospora corallina TaxID=1806052 RepID=A0ABV8IIJ7_9ACTN
MSPNGPDRQAELITAALAAAVDGDGQAVDACMSALAGHGWPALYGATVCFGQAVHRIAGLADGEDLLALVLADTGGGPPGLDGCGLPEPSATALQIFTAWGSGDPDAARRLYDDAVQRGCGHEVTAAALTLAAALIGRVAQRQAAGTE